MICVLGVPRSTQCMVRRTVCMRYGDLCEIFARLKTTASRTSVGGTQTCSMVAIEMRFAANCTQGNVLRIRRQPGQLEAVVNSTDNLIVLPGEESFALRKLDSLELWQLMVLLTSSPGTTRLRIAPSACCSRLVPCVYSLFVNRGFLATQGLSICVLARPLWPASNHDSV